MNFSLVNSSSEIPPRHNHKIAIISAVSGFVANGTKVHLNEYNQLNLPNHPMLVTGFVKEAVPGTVFYYYQQENGKTINFK